MVLFVGSLVGAWEPFVGPLLGDSVGAFEGDLVGAFDGKLEGTRLGLLVGF